MQKNTEEALYTWFARQPLEVQETAKQRQLEYGYAPFILLLDALVAADATLTSGQQYDALTQLFNRLPTKLPFRMAVAQNLESLRVYMLLMATEGAFAVNGAEQYLQAYGSTHFYKDSIAEFEAKFNEHSPMTEVNAFLEKCKKKHERLERVAA